MQSVRPHLASKSRSIVPRAGRTCARALCAGLFGALLLTACAATGGAGGRTAGTVEYTIFGNGTTLRIVSDGWVAAKRYEGESAEERRADFYRKNVYSSSGPGVAVKVCEDEVFEGLVTALESEGFGRYATDGAGPMQGGAATQVIELTQGGATRHFARAPGLSPEAAKSFVDCAKLLGNVFNVIQGYQSGDKGFRFEESGPGSGRRN